ncbi:relaxase domain-containing protein [Streptomyces sp. NPDC057729]|uniref:relaxase domain-containing protein n=1 Tax=Streptomyces sp. NPDC057729 TaxID=3346230 RepID=UPI0036BAA595
MAVHAAAREPAPPPVAPTRRRPGWPPSWGSRSKRSRSAKRPPLLALDFTFRPQASLIVLWALGDDHTRRVVERAHEKAIATALLWFEDEVAETWWLSGRQRAKAPALVVFAGRTAKPPYQLSGGGHSTRPGRAGDRRGCGESDPSKHGGPDGQPDPDVRCRSGGGRVGVGSTRRVEPAVAINRVGVESTTVSIGWEWAPLR